MSIYLSSYDNVPAYKDAFGFMLSIEQGNRGGIRRGMPWMLDNGVFTFKFNERRWLDLLAELQPYQPTCLGIITPDVVGDWKGTLERFAEYAPAIKERGYPVAFVTQDGLTPNKTPWADFDVLFVGGTDQHKLGPEAMSLILEAKRRDKWVHIGRVNSVKRMMQFWIADSWDGTEISINPSRGCRLLGRAVRQIRAMKKQPALWAD